MPRWMDLPQQQCKPAPLQEATRLEDLHHKLSNAERELNKLSDQLASAEVAKVDAEEALEKAKKQVFTVTPEPKFEGRTLNSPPTATASEPVKPIGSLQEQDAHQEAEEKSNKGKIMGKEEAEVHNSAPDAQVNEREMKAKMASMEAELKDSRARTAELTEQLAVVQGAKSALELEMKRLRVQTDQWRKAAEAATALLAAADGDVTGQRGRRVRVTERPRSTDKYFGWGSPLSAGGVDEAVGGGGRWNAARSRRLGDLWKKKMQRDRAEEEAGRE